MTPPPDVPGERAVNSETCPLFTHGICYLEISTFYDGGGMIGVGFQTENFQWREKLTGDYFSGENLHWGNLTEFLYEIIFIVLLSFYELNFACGDGMGIIWGIFSVFRFIEKYFYGGGFPE